MIAICRGRHRQLMRVEIVPQRPRTIPQLPTWKLTRSIRSRREIRLARRFVPSFAALPGPVARRSQSERSVDAGQGRRNEVCPCGPARSNSMHGGSPSVTVSASDVMNAQRPRCVCACLRNARSRLRCHSRSSLAAGRERSVCSTTRPAARRTRALAALCRPAAAPHRCPADIVSTAARYART